MGYTIGNSLIHGKGVISSAFYKQWDVIGVAIVFCKIGFVITEDLGKYVNHSYFPNSKLIRSGLVFNLVAIKDIKSGEEITANYNDSPEFIERAKSFYK
jgi:hypothetical protein